jgi:hypothetical protein
MGPKRGRFIFGFLNEIHIGIFIFSLLSKNARPSFDLEKVGI